MDAEAAEDVRESSIARSCGTGEHAKTGYGVVMVCRVYQAVKMTTTRDMA